MKFCYYVYNPILKFLTSVLNANRFVIIIVTHVNQPCLTFTTTAAILFKINMTIMI